MSSIMNENHESMADGKIDIEDPQVLVALNTGLAETTVSSSITPYVAWARIQKVLATYHLFIPNAFLEGSDGNEVMPISQFGKKFGMTDDGKVVSSDETKYFLYFEWQMDDDGGFTVFAEIVDDEDLEEILADYDAEAEPEEEEEEMNESKKGDVPFDNPTEKPSTPYKNPHSKAKQLARSMMKKFKANMDKNNKKK